MKIGYILESLYCNLSYEMQKRELEKWNCDKIYGDKVNRYNYPKNLAKAIANTKEGDTFVICRADVIGGAYLARLSIKLNEKGIKFHLLDKEGLRYDIKFPENKK